MRKMTKYIFILFVITFFFSIKLILKPFVPLVWLKVDNAFHQGNYDMAENYLTFISWVEPKNPEAYVLKGWLQWSQAKNLCSFNLPYKDKLNCALQTYRKGQKNVPSDWQLYFEEGIMWEAFGENKKAVEAYYKVSNLAKKPYSKIYFYKSKKYNVKVEENN